MKECSLNDIFSIRLTYPSQSPIIWKGSVFCMKTLIVPLVGLAVVFVGLVVVIAIVKLMGIICGLVTGRRTKATVSIPSSGTEAEKTVADGTAHKLTGESRRELIAVISAAIAETIGTDAAGLRIKSIKKIG
mgnify:CR=1 FL=1